MIILFLGCTWFVQAQLTTVEDFGANPGQLRLHLHIPDTYDNTENMPLVVALHGCSQSIENMAEQSGWNTLADHYNFIVLYPEQRTMNNWSKCFNWFRQKDIDSTHGELASIRQMITYVTQHYNIDTNRIYTYGLSAGAVMSATLLATFPHLFEAGAVFAGAPYKVADNVFQGMKVLVNTPDRNPSEWKAKLPYPDIKPPGLFVYHGQKDNVVDIKNAHELIEQWSAWNEIEAQPSSITTPFDGHQGIIRYDYKNETGDTAIVFLELENVGHELAVDPGQGEKQGGATGPYATDINFFSTYYVALFFNLL